MLIEIQNEFIEIDENSKVSIPTKSICDACVSNLIEYGFKKQNIMTIIKECPLILRISPVIINNILNRMSEGGKYANLYVITQVIRYPERLVNNLYIVP